MTNRENPNRQVGVVQKLENRIAEGTDCALAVVPRPDIQTVVGVELNLSTSVKDPLILPKGFSGLLRMFPVPRPENVPQKKVQIGQAHHSKKVRSVVRSQT